MQCFLNPRASRCARHGLHLSGFAALVGLAATAIAAEPVSVGFAKADITPDVSGDNPVWIAGYGQNRRATGVHDPLYARGLVARHGEQRIALVAVDLVGLQYPTVLKIRERLPDYSYVLVASTHNHEGPDTIGLWGPSPVQSGVDPAYLDLVVDRVAALVAEADAAAVPVKAEYGTAQDDTLLRDSRLPLVFDGILRAVKFTRLDDGRPLALLVQWNCHPEGAGSRNTLITADFPFATIAHLESALGCPVAYFSGAVGGLMTTPDGRVKNAAGEPLDDGTIDYIEPYGVEVGRLAERALENASPVELAPLDFAARPIAVPMTNPLYHVARSIGVLPRQGRRWTGDFEQLGEPLDVPGPDRIVAVETEVSYVRLGDLHIAGIPGEIYPELVYGNYQHPVDPGADYLDAPLETPVMKLLPGDKPLLIGLANDEIGYIVPKRQWDEIAPFAYGRDKKQYGEVNSIGPDAAPILMQALENRIRDAAK